jgi:hypothetical protein
VALSLSILHAVLLVGWGLLLNESLGGYRYCRFTMPLLRDEGSWVFSIIGIVILIGVAAIDRFKFRLHPRLCWYSIPVFVVTQLFALYLMETNARFPEINW